MVIRPSKNFASRLVSSAATLLEASDGFLEAGATSETPKSILNIPSANQENKKNDEFSLKAEEKGPSRIETYFRAWNARDMKTALDCFADDCIYQTEDPVFVDTFRGKNALLQNLEKNAAALPSTCQIIWMI